MTSLNRRLPSSLFRLSVRLRLLALNSRKKRLSLSGLSRMLRRATSPPFGSSSLITSAARTAGIGPRAGPAWLCVMSITRMFDNAWFIWPIPAENLATARVYVNRKPHGTRDRLQAVFKPLTARACSDGRQGRRPRRERRGHAAQYADAPEEAAARCGAGDECSGCRKALIEPQGRRW